RQHATPLRASLALFQRRRDQHRLILLLIVAAIQQRHRAVLALQPLHFVQQVFFLGQFSLVALHEFSPLLRVVPKPFSQRIARRNLFHPQIRADAFFRQAARPQAVHQQAKPILLGGLFIDTFHANHLAPHRKIFSTSSCSKPFVLTNRPL